MRSYLEGGENRETFFGGEIDLSATAFNKICGDDGFHLSTKWWKEDCDHKHEKYNKTKRNHLHG